MFKSNRGQLSIFLGITLVLVMGMLAFIINIGMFVKAKINLQNAVDAAAFSGASVQARQLTNIAYINWEMRNNYKEWLFKYYVLGQLSSLRPGYNYPLQLSLSQSKMNFTLKYLDYVKPVSGDNMCIGCVGTGSKTPAFDKYNVPSICIHNSATHDICPSYVIPGLPRFPAIGVAGISEIHETAVSELVKKKSENCSIRSRENFEAALTWAYGEGTKDSQPLPGIPPILAANRPGAWPRAVELGMRMRNLEMIVNLPAQTEITHQKVEQYPTLPGANFSYYERPYKAYISALKNLGGGKYKDESREELSNNFVLHELAPQAQPVEQNSLSGFLIPNNSIGTQALKKSYLDLQAIPLNLATMYSTFTSTTSDIGEGIISEGTCGVSKTAMPVPGFILGFVKNPNVLTYYAVKGESKFIGMFSPFKGTNNEQGVKLTAYAAAKPFGGRIGPKLFSFKDNSTVQVRTSDQNSNRSLAYVYGLKIPEAVKFNPGDPIPVSAEFWVHSFGGHSDLGGVPTSMSDKTYFGIPNMVYDYVNINHQVNAGLAANGEVVEINSRFQAADPVKEELGLYDSEQFNLLKSSLVQTATTKGYTGFDITNAIVKARRATRYDVVNYLVPDHNPSGPQNALPSVTEIGKINPQTQYVQPYKLFAPLFGESLLYQNDNDIKTAIGDYVNSMSSAVTAFDKGLYDVAKSIFKLPTISSTGAGNTNIEAAQTVHVNASKDTYEAPPALNSANCKNDIASKFWQFFKSPVWVEVCKVKPLKLMVNDFINGQADGDKKMFFYSEYYIGPTSEGALPQEQLYTAYFPGPRQGVNASSSGSGNMASSPLGIASNNSDYNARRNYYSTKFFRMAMAITSSGNLALNEPALREERDAASTGPDFQEPHLQNPIMNDTSIGLGGNFFLDF